MCNVLEEHDDVVFSRVKEPNYYSAPLGQAELTSWYNSLFDIVSANDERLIGEGSVSYTNPNRVDFTVKRIAKANPDCKFIFMVRHPIRRLESDWKMRFREGRFSTDYETSLRKQATLLNHGLYWKAISKYLEHFPEENLLVVFLEDFKSDFNREMLRVYEHLGLSPENVTSQPQQAIKSNQADNYRQDTAISSVIRTLPLEKVTSFLPRKLVLYVKSKLTRSWDYDLSCSEEIRREASEFYKEDVRELLQFCGKSADFWDLDS